MFRFSSTTLANSKDWLPRIGNSNKKWKISLIIPVYPKEGEEEKVKKTKQRTSIDSKKWMRLIGIAVNKSQLFTCTCVCNTTTILCANLILIRIQSHCESLANGGVVSETEQSDYNSQISRLRHFMWRSSNNSWVGYRQ